jgi:hypothetical protein
MSRENYNSMISKGTGDRQGQPGKVIERIDECKL